MTLKKLLMRLKPYRYYYQGKKLIESPFYLEVKEKKRIEDSKTPDRTAILNYILSTRHMETHYLEIGVRNPDDNFNHIKADKKYGVDPGVEFESNPVDFKMTSDTFFEQLAASKVLSATIKFDVIFVDGSHYAEQVNRDISNALDYVKDDGFVVLHDCNPLSEWHARENFDYKLSPAGNFWNGTTWKAFMKWRFNQDVYSCCVDTDWGIGVLSKKQPIGKSLEPSNLFYEFHLFEKNRSTYLNLIDFQTFKSFINA